MNDASFAAGKKIIIFLLSSVFVCMCNKESDSILDVWLLTSFKPHPSPFSFCPDSRASWNNKFGVSAFVTGRKFRPPNPPAQTPLHPREEFKTVASPCSFSNLFRFALDLALLSQHNFIMWVRNLFISSWCICDVTKPDLGGKGQAGSVWWQ